MASETPQERLRSLAAQAQQMLRLAQRAEAGAAQTAPPSAPLPSPADDDVLHLATALETLTTALTSHLEGERERALAERTRLAAILEAMGDAVLVVDAAGTPLLTNWPMSRIRVKVGHRNGRLEPLPGDLASGKALADIARRVYTRD